MSSSTRARRITQAIAAAIGATALVPVVLGGVLVAPHAVFIDHRARTGQFTLANPSSETEEVEIELMYGYPETDSSGNPYVKLIPEPESGAPSAAGWIKAFPRRARLEPGQRQVVRLLARPPADLPDGEYWTRLIVTSRRAQDAVARVDTTLRAGLTLELRTIISVTYRKGSVETGIRLNDLRQRIEGDSLIVWVDLEREGNAAFLGTVRFSMSDENEQTVGEWSTPIAVYHGQNRRFALPVDQLPLGLFQVRFTVDTRRDDLPQTNILPADPIARSFGIEKR